MCLMNIIIIETIRNNNKKKYPKGKGFIFVMKNYTQKRQFMNFIFLFFDPTYFTETIVLKLCCYYDSYLI